VIEQLLPDWATAGHFRTALTDEPLSGLVPEEAARMAHTVPKRQREFASVRACAWRALSRLGRTPGCRDGGASQWPAGMDRSMMHCDGIAPLWSPEPPTRCRSASTPSPTS